VTETKTKQTKAEKRAARAAKQKEPTVEADQATDQRVASFPGSVPSEQFPERRPADMDVADIKNPDKEYKGEHLAPITLESWVTLGKHKLVPKELEGRLAAVISAPTITVVDEDTGEEYVTVPPKAAITVKERSQGTILYLPREAFAEIHTNGRVGALGFA